MQDRPTADELLSAIAELLEGPVLEAIEGPLKHQVRVAGNLSRILEREFRDGPALEAREVALLADLLGEAGGADGAAALSERLAARLQAGDPELARRAWPALVEIVRGKLGVAKPGHSDYDFAGELGE